VQKIKRNIPNAITCGNLFCGCVALVKAAEGNLIWAAYLVGIAVILDFFDGFTARLLKVSSAIGKDLDSLADMVTFGVVPGVIMFQMIKNSLLTYYFSSENYNPSLPYPWYCQYVPYVAFMLTIFSAIRLAKFNNDPRQSDSFIGLPTPANAIFFCSFPLISEQIMLKYNSAKDPFKILINSAADPILSLINNHWVLIALVIILSFLLIAEIPLFALKFKSFAWAGNEIKFLFIIISLALMGIYQFMGIPLAIVLYVLISMVNNLFNRSKKSVE
jgi:CDP-diacylglycerol---serine O-phosphatidyltransferase